MMKIRLSELRSIIREEIAAPGTRVYRCVCGVKPGALNRLLGSAARQGGIVTMNLPPGRSFTPARHRWWSTDPRGAASFLDRSAVGKNADVEAYDVMITGILPTPFEPNDGRIDIDGDETGVTGLHVAYAPAGCDLNDLMDALVRHG